MKSKVLTFVFLSILLTGCSSLSNRYSLEGKGHNQKNGIVYGAVAGGLVGVTGGPLMAAAGAVGGAELGSNLGERVDMNRRIGPQFEFTKEQRGGYVRDRYFVRNDGYRVRETQGDDFYYRSDYW